MAISSVDEFLQQLNRSRLFSEEQLVQLRNNLPADNNIEARKLAVVLVKRGLLTRWQAEKLLSPGGEKIPLVLGEYKLVEQVGRGGRGEVFKAIENKTENILAIKVLPAEFVEKPEALQRFQREARVAAALDHPNIIACYKADCDDKTHFLVMEYMQGKDLNRWLDDFRPLPIDWCCESIRQAAVGLQHAHVRGMVHRDIKPGNILVAAEKIEDQPVAKLLDMGFARMKGDSEEEGGKRLTQAWQVFGTPDYMSPEQAESTRNADIRSDVYSLGVTLFKLLTGELPFQGGSALQKLVARAKRDAPRVRSLRKDVPEDVDEVVAKMLARLPDERYQTPADVVVALAPFARSTSGIAEMEAETAAAIADGTMPTPFASDPAPVEDSDAGISANDFGDSDMHSGDMGSGDMMPDIGPPPQGQEVRETPAATPDLMPDAPVAMPDMPVSPVPSAPEPISAPAPEPISAPAPEPISAPAPEPVSAPAPEPVSAPAPEPISAPAPEPVSAPAPEPISAPAPAPVSTREPASPPTGPSEPVPAPSSVSELPTTTPGLVNDGQSPVAQGSGADQPARTQQPVQQQPVQQRQSAPRQSAPPEPFKPNLKAVPPAVLKGMVNGGAMGGGLGAGVGSILGVLLAAGSQQWVLSVVLGMLTCLTLGASLCAAYNGIVKGIEAAFQDDWTKR